MATEPHNQTKPLEEEVADLKLEGKAGGGTDTAKDYEDSVKEAAKISAKDAATDFNKPAKGASEETDTSESPQQSADSREVNIAQKEAQKNPDETSYVVPAVDNRSVQQPGGEEMLEVPTAVVHEIADSTESPAQQGKGIIHSITRSVKNVFSGIAGGSKGDKSSESNGGAASD